MTANLCYHCFQDKPENESVCPHCGYDAAADADAHPLALPCGTVLGGKYILGHVLGQGGFGITYIAQDYQTKERVAVKEFFPDAMAMRTQKHTVSAHSGEQKENFQYGKACFLSEAETLAEFIGNPNIIRVYSYFEENGTAYYVMEYIEGESLQHYVRAHDGKISWEETKKFLFPIMEALGAVHEKGIIHRDVTPDNIYITKDGNVKLIDFGAARYSLGEKSRSLDVIIKHGFAPMEQYTRRSKQGPYTDVYALAATMYYVLSGKLPPDSIDRLEEDHLADLNAQGVDIPPNAERAIEKALSLRHADRFQSMAEFKDALTAEKPMTEQAERFSTEPVNAPVPSLPGKSAPASDPIQLPIEEHADDTQNRRFHIKKEWIPLGICTVWVTIVFAITANTFSKKNEVRQSAIVTETATAAAVSHTSAAPETTIVISTTKRKETSKANLAATQRTTTKKVTTAPIQTTLPTTLQTTLQTTVTVPTTAHPITTQSTTLAATTTKATTTKATTTQATTTKATTTIATTTKATTTQATTTQATTTSKKTQSKFSGRGTPNSSDGFANLRSSMDYSDNVVFPVENGHLLYVSSTDDPEWYEVYPEGSGYGGGYMKASLVELFDDLKNVKKPSNMTYLGRGTSTSADGFLNVHVDASITKGNTVDTLPNGAYGDVYSYGNKDWYYIKTATGFGYVKAAFIRMLKKGEREEIVYNSEFGYSHNMDAARNSSTKQSVQTCNLSGNINTHGKKVASFTTDYVVNHGKSAYVRESLGNSWHINAVRYCYSYDVHWYELYDADDGDYYGWVDENYIDFYE